jgi:tetratricopeptide (TPR) repeat protein
MRPRKARMVHVRLLAVVLASIVGLASATPTFAQDRQDAEARALFQAGQVAFEDGRFDSALEYFQRAYDLSHRAALLYNIGTAADRLRQDRVALDAFEHYLEAEPNSANRAEVSSRVQVLRRALATSETSTATTTAATTTTTPAASVGLATSGEAATTASSSASGASASPSSMQVPPSEDTGPGIAPWILFGSGLAVTVAGAVLVGVAASNVASVEGAAQGSRWSSVSGSYDQSEPLSIAGFVCLGVGVAGAAGGLGWALAGGGSRTEVAILPGSVSVRGSF